MNKRRELILDNLQETITECKRLLDSGYQANGKWTLAQMCCHIRLTMESNMQGYPKWMTTLGYPLRPILRKLALPRILSGNSINGVKTAGMFIPSSNLDDHAELEKLEQCVHDFQANTNQLHAHPGFGKMSKEGFEQFHAAHAAHHLSFLSTQSPE